MMRRRWRERHPEVYADYVLAYIAGLVIARREDLSDFIPLIDGPVSVRPAPENVSGLYDFLGCREVSERRQTLDIEIHGPRFAGD